MLSPSLHCSLRPSRAPSIHRGGGLERVGQATRRGALPLQVPRRTAVSLRAANTGAAQPAAATTAEHSLGLVLGQPPHGEAWWDQNCFAGPVVIPGATGSAQHGGRGGRAGSAIPASKWRMYYYGRDTDMFNKGVKASPSPFGRVGLALSDDGIHWERFQGALPGGAIFDPSDEDEAFDCVHVNVTEVIPPLEGDKGPFAGLWRMYYFGQGLEEGVIPGSGFRTGLATSEDGIVFERLKKPVLRESDGEAFAAFARVAPPEQPGMKWQMSYHTYGEEEHTEGGETKSSLITCIAESDDGVRWEKKGRVLPGGPKGAWDETGVGMRHVIKVDGTYSLLYTGVNSKFDFAVGLASSKDGKHWEKVKVPGREPGGPVFEPRKGKDVWDSGVVGAPYLIERPNGEIWMYYMGGSFKEDRSLKTGIGLAVCKTRDCMTWERFGTPT